MTLTNEQKRQQSGRNMEESRRASGRKMRDDMRALAENNRLERTLPVLPVRGNQPAKRGSALWQGGAPASSGGGGIASPLTETSFSDRTYYDNKYIFSGDFLMGLEIRAVKEIVMKDANQASVVLTFKEPVY